MVLSYRTASFPSPFPSFLLSSSGSVSASATVVSVVAWASAIPRLFLRLDPLSFLFLRSPHRDALPTTTPGASRVLHTIAKRQQTVTTSIDQHTVLCKNCGGSRRQQSTTGRQHLRLVLVVLHRLPTRRAQRGKKAWQHRRRSRDLWGAPPFPPCRGARSVFFVGQPDVVISKERAGGGCT